MHAGAQEEGEVVALVEGVGVQVVSQGAVEAEKT